MSTFALDSHLNDKPGNAESIVVYHGGERELPLDKIEFAGRRRDYDFGDGFYVTENRQVAEEWSKDRSTPVVNAYRLEIPSNEILHLKDQDWLRVIVGFRLQKYKVVFKSSYIRGAIANDRMDVSLSFFLSGEIGDLRLIKCLEYCKLGDQYLLKKLPDKAEHLEARRLHGLALQTAYNRNIARRHNMDNALLKIRRQSVEGELFIDDYLAKGDYIE